jgi:hypothetical protein
MTDSIQAVAESTAIRLQARGAAIEIIPLLSAGNTYGEGHLVFKVESILQDGYFTALKSFGSSFNKTGDSTWTITAEFTDGTPMLLDFTLTTQEGEYVGWNPPRVDIARDLRTCFVSFLRGSPLLGRISSLGGPLLRTTFQALQEIFTSSSSFLQRCNCQQLSFMAAKQQT